MSTTLVGPKPLKPRARFLWRRNVREFKLHSTGGAISRTHTYPTDQRGCPQLSGGSTRRTFPGTSLRRLWG